MQCWCTESYILTRPSIERMRWAKIEIYTAGVWAHDGCITWLHPTCRDERDCRTKSNFLKTIPWGAGRVQSELWLAFCRKLCFLLLHHSASMREEASWLATIDACTPMTFKRGSCSSFKVILLKRTYDPPLATTNSAKLGQLVSLSMVQGSRRLLSIETSPTDSGQSDLLIRPSRDNPWHHSMDFAQQKQVSFFVSMFLPEPTFLGLKRGPLWLARCIRVNGVIAHLNLSRPWSNPSPVRPLPLNTSWNPLLAPRGETWPRRWVRWVESWCVLASQTSWLHITLAWSWRLDERRYNG